MNLSEMALHNVRSIRTLLRMKLTPGLNLILGRNGSGKSTLVDTLFALLTPTAEHPDILEGQGGIIYEAHDGYVYRFVRDFSKNKSSLARRDDQGKFIPLNQEEGWILSFVLGDFKGYSVSDLRDAAVIDKTSMPSSRGRASALPPVSESTVSTVVSTAPVLSEAERSQKETRLEELRAQLTHVDEAAVLEDRMAELQGRAVDLKRRLRVHAEKTTALEEISQRNRGFESLWPLPEGYDQILTQFDEQGAEFGKTIEAIEEEHAEVTAGLAVVPSQAVYLTPLFLSGAAVLAISFIAPMVVDISGIIQKLFFIPLAAGIGLIGFAVIRDFSRTAQKKTMNARLHALLNHRDESEMNFDENSKPARELLQKANCATTEEFRKKAAAYEQVLVLKRDIVVEQERILEGKSPEEIQQEIAGIAEKVRETESQITSLTSQQSDLYLVEEEIRRLESELAQGSQPDASTPFSDISPEPEPEPVAPGGAYDFLIPGPLRKLLQREKIESGLMSGRETLADRIRRYQDRFPQAKPFSMEVGENLEVTIKDREGRSVSPLRLSSGLLDQLSFVLQAVLGGHLLHTLRFPMLLDDPLTSMDRENQEAALDLIREMTQYNQVLWMTSTPHPAKEGDGTNTLPPPAA